jgi:5-methylcytosine-specific restriction protein A
MPTKAPLSQPPNWTPPRRAYERERGTPHARGYDEDWRKFRLGVLSRNPLCLFCEQIGKVVPATDVDHIQTIQSRPDLRLDESNVRPLCHSCHSSRTARDQRWGGREA